LVVSQDIKLREQHIYADGFTGEEDYPLPELQGVETSPASKHCPSPLTVFSKAIAWSVSQVVEDTFISVQ
jgi:hypothetical protein